MIKLGVSLYPEQETLEDIDSYLKMASKYGFEKVFTSMFSVLGTKEEIIKYFSDFCEIAHKYNMVVSGDCNAEFFNRIDATESDLTVFKEMGIDIIRMDFSYNDKRDAILINNSEGILIEMSTGFKDVILNAIKNGANKKKISTCHNFYPQRYTAPDLKVISEINDYWKSQDVSVAFFITSQEKGTHGPWPVSDGLCTIEDHRNLPIEVQLKHALSLKNIDEILIGNAYASEEEFKAIYKVMKEAYVNIPLKKELDFLVDYIPCGNITRIPFKINLAKDISNLEKEILFNYPTHADLGDCLNYMLRSRWTRFLYKNESIPERKTDKSVFTRGDVLIVNDNLKHYAGEIQIVLKDMIVDNQRNFLGRICEDEIMILNHIKANDVFTFIE